MLVKFSILFKIYAYIIIIIIVKWIAKLDKK
jgi:hypothetical protein